MNLSKNLSIAEMLRSESAKRNGLSNAAPAAHIANMEKLAVNIFQPIRDHFAVPIHVSSGYRSKDLNKLIGGSQASQHSRGEAMDIDMDGTIVKNRDVFHYILKNLPFDQLIWEFGNSGNPDWVHVSYSSTGKQRGQALVAKKIDGKTVYLNF